MSDLNQGTAPSTQPQPITGNALLNLFQAALDEGHRPFLLLGKINSACSLKLETPQNLIRLAPAEAARVADVLRRLPAPPQLKPADVYPMIKQDQP